jgi:hypothetical protein
MGLWLAVPRNEPPPGWPLTISTMTSRLSTIAVDLVERLSQEPPSRLRQVAAAAAGLAVERTHLANPRIDAALAAVRDDVPAAMPELLQVLALTEELDEIAWDAKDKVDAGALPRQAYLVAWAHARAAASAAFALEPDALHAALESVYEAKAAVADLEAVRVAVAVALDG